jgi:hypothetical protein
MPALLIPLVVGVGLIPVQSVGDLAALARVPAETRTETMPFGQCIGLAEDVAEGLNTNPVTILRTTEVRVVRIDAADGVVILTCNRSENRMVLTKRPR